MAAVGVERLRSEQLLGLRGGVRGSDGIDAHDLWLLVEQGYRARVELRGKAVEDALVGEVGPHRDAVQREARQHLLLRGSRLRAPRTLLGLRREVRLRQTLADR